MSLQTRTLLGLVAGALAGLLAWVLTDLTGWFTRILNQPQFSLASSDGLLFLIYGGIFGLILGLLLAVVDSMSMNTKAGFLKQLAIGSATGFASGFIGILFGQKIFGILVPTESAAEGPLGLIGRSAGYAIIGIFVGASNGISRRSMTMARQGAFGGFCGGLLGGFCFQTIDGMFKEVAHHDILSRLIALVCSGALVGFFVGLVQNAMKQAWIRIVLGKNEGSEHLLTKPITTLGRSELADIPLYGDSGIAPTHIAIESIPSQKRHRLRHVAAGDTRGRTFPPSLVNGQPVSSELWLADGDTIQIGGRTIVFHEKATRGQSLPVSANVPQERRPAVMPAEEWSAAPSALPLAVSPQPVQAVPESASTMAPAPPQTVAQTGTRLVSIRGPYSGQSFPLTHSSSTIGRSPECSISLPADTSISRKHAVIQYIAGRHVVADDASSNGVVVSGEKVLAQKVLALGDIVQLGETMLRYE